MPEILVGWSRAYTVGSKRYRGTTVVVDRGAEGSYRRTGGCAIHHKVSGRNCGDTLDDVLDHARRTSGTDGPSRCPTSHVDKASQIRSGILPKAVGRLGVSGVDWPAEGALWWTF